MKITKYLLIGMLAMGLAACEDTPDGPSNKKPVNGGDDDTEQPGTGPTTDDENVVSPESKWPLVDENVTIDADQTYQTMEGIGASDCWLPNQIGQYWGIKRSDIARMLFSQEIRNGIPQGIGLSMWRVNLGGGTAEQGDAGKIDLNNRAEAYLSGTTYDWNKCAGQRYFMQQAKNAGCESFVLFSNTPLVQWTKNGYGFSNSGSNSNLKDEHYGDFAAYMATVAKHFVNEGYPITHISPVNEPQFNWDGHGQEGSGWKNSQIAKLAKELDAAIETAGISTKILIPEATSWDQLYNGNANDRANQIEAFFNDKSENYLGNLKHIAKVCAGHSYWTHFNWSNMRTVRKTAYDKASRFGIGLWQTEWSMLDKEPDLIGSYDKATEWDIAIYMSNVIHNDFTVANCSSWSYWTAMSVERYSQKNRFELIKTTPLDGSYSDNFTVEGTVTPTYNLWVLGNYSLFIRPGYKRIQLDNKDTEAFFGSGWISPDGSKIVCVYTNYDRDNAKKIKTTFKGDRTPKSIYTYTTSTSKELQQARFKVGDDVFVDPYSVTTVVYNF